MDSTDYAALFAGYAAALAGWIVMARLLPDLWPRREAVTFEHAWREVGWAILGGVAVLGVGRLYTLGWLLPGGARLAALAEAGNQLLIFSPILTLPWWRGQDARSAWLPGRRVWLRVLVGAALGALAIGAFTAIHPTGERWVDSWRHAFAPGNFGLAVQVLCEDITIAILFVRVRAALGLPGSALLVALLFAAGHIPALLAQGASTLEFEQLGLDAVLGLSILLVVQRSADVWWFWGVHFAMDMMQFNAGAHAPG